ncbi:DUF1576 domain-containing protein [Isachenkonia alkalipeptolytica]|uniref:DUF1576 domain-containing protein n=1 Tax=Isachenkonia alkalipeptolytica TaxID=2565777 RepID=A0AA44BDF1_9CLOT|nr:DUF1576 domain-containing protein [Isachenkonia alkalipeptolytica]NBG88259.1 DUF1576 domain-containing protein [Isachenkonia alkalipeptolytica]
MSNSSVVHAVRENLSEPKEESQEEVETVIPVSDDTKYYVILGYAIAILLSSLIFNTPMEILRGMQAIIVAPSILVSDYFEIANIGSALFNSGLLMIVAIGIARKNEVNMNGPLMAAILTIGGFALFGKNLYNILPILFGVFLYSRVQKEKYNKFILPAFFGTALGPLVSQVSFGYDFPLIQGILLAVTFGTLAGFVLPSLAAHFVRFHQGFNLYNIGFTCGVTGMVFMAVFRAFGYDHEGVLFVSSGNNPAFSLYLGLLFTSFIVVGLYFNRWRFKGYKNLLTHAGQLVTDFVTISGFGITMINMGILGLISTLYVVMVNGELNGPIIGGIFTIVGFGAFGKHTKNILPIFVGIYLATLFNIWDVNSTGALLGALFGTTLAPISGRFGWPYGVLAGFLHMAMVMNVGAVHGGMNLYNNGFSGGFVAAFLVAIITSLKKEVI